MRGCGRRLHRPPPFSPRGSSASVRWIEELVDLPDAPLPAGSGVTADTVRDLLSIADAVIVGSCVPEGIEIGDWVLDEARGFRRLPIELLHPNPQNPRRRFEPVSLDG